MTVDLAKDAARQRAKRAAVKAMLLSEFGSACDCGAPAWAFARTRLSAPRLAPPEGRSRRYTLDGGPSDRGLTGRLDLILRACAGRRPTCRDCWYAGRAA